MIVVAIHLNLLFLLIHPYLLLILLYLLLIHQLLQHRSHRLQQTP